MARIQVVDPSQAKGIRRLILRASRRDWGGDVPGIMQVAAVDLQVGMATNWLYSRLALHKRSTMTRLQREMVALVVNGLIGGAP